MGAPRVMLALYVAASSARSERARRRWVALLGEYDATAFAIEVRDVEDPLHACAIVADRVSKTPTMIIRGRSSERVVGDLAPDEVSTAIEVLALWGLRAPGVDQ